MPLAISQLRGFNSVRAVTAPLGPAVLTFRNFFNDYGDKTVYTTGAVGLGAASANKIVLVVVQAKRSASGILTVSSVTIGGIGASLLATAVVGVGSEYHAIWGANVGLLTSASVVVTFGSLCRGAYIITETLESASSMTPQAQATDVGIGAGTVTISSVAMPTDGCILASAMIAGVSSATWTGPTEHWDAGSFPDVDAVSSGAGVNATPTASVAVTHSGSYAGLLVASFR